MSRRMVTAALALAAVPAGSASTAVALPPPGGDPIPHCPAGYHLEDDICVKNPPPPPQNSPVLSVGIPRQSTDQRTIHVNGRATDADLPNAAVTVRISVDGVLTAVLAADAPDDPVATPGFAKTGGVTPTGHTFETSVSAPAGAQQLCVTAVNAGSTGHDTTLCRGVDRVLEFRANSIAYDMANVAITDESEMTFDRVTNTNNTSVQQSTTITGETTVAETHGWSITTGLKVTASGSVGIPFVSEGKVSVEGSFSYTNNSSETTTRKFAWSQPVLVPAHSKVVATVGATKTKLNVPFSLVGSFLYSSGFQAAGRMDGVFEGANGHDLGVSLQQFDLDGTPAAKPVPQPRATFLRAL